MRRINALTSKIIFCFSLFIITVNSYGQLGSFGPGGVGTNTPSSEDPNFWFKPAGVDHTGTTYNGWDNTMNTSTSSELSVYNSNSPDVKTPTIDSKSLDVAEFVASSSEALQATTAFTPLNSGDVEVVMMVKPTDLTSERGLFSVTDATVDNNSYGFTITANGELKAYLREADGPSTSSTVLGSTSTFTANNWHILKLRIGVSGTTLTVDNVRVDGAAIGGTTSANFTIPSSGFDPDILKIGLKEINDGSDLFFEGQIAEIAVYDALLNVAQLNIVENYLAEKYGITITSDKYSASGNYYNGVPGTPTAKDHDYDLAGLGGETGDYHNAAQSNIIRIDNTGANLGIGEYIMFGHNGKSCEKFSLLNAPENVFRTRRTWKVDMTGGITSKVVDLKLDIDMLNSDPDLGTKETWQRYILLVDNDGNGDFYSNKVRKYTVNVASGYFTVSNFELKDGDYIGLGVEGAISCFYNKPNDTYITAIGKLDATSFDDASELSDNLEITIDDVNPFVDGEIMTIGFAGDDVNSNGNFSFPGIEQIERNWCISLRADGQSRYFDFAYVSNLAGNAVDLDADEQYVLIIGDNWDLDDPQFYLMRDWEGGSDGTSNKHFARKVPFAPGQHFVSIGKLLAPDPVTGFDPERKSGLVQERKWSFNANGQILDDLYLDPEYPETPDGVGYDGDPSIPSTTDLKEGFIIEGYYQPDATGNHTFRIDADYLAEFWLSDDESPSGLSRRCWDQATGGSPSPVSSAISLNSSNKYFYRIVHTSDHISTNHMTMDVDDGGGYDPFDTHASILAIEDIGLIGKDDGNFNVSSSSAGNLEFNGSNADIQLKLTSGSISNQSFVHWAHDGGAFNDVHFESGTSFDRIARKWFIKYISKEKSITLDFDFGSNSMPTKGTEESYLLLIDDDGNFTNGGTKAYGLSDPNIDVTGIEITGDCYVSLGVTSSGCTGATDEAAIGFGDILSTDTYVTATSDELRLSNESPAHTSNPLIKGEFGVLANDNVALGSPNSTEAATNTLKYDKEWCFDMTSDAAAKRLRMRVATFGSPATYQKRAFFVDDDGNFSNGGTQVIVMDAGTGEYYYNDMSLKDDNHISYGYLHDYEFSAGHGTVIESMGMADFNYDVRSLTNTDLTIESPEEPMPGDYYILGRDAGATAITNVDVPTGFGGERMTRTWRVDKYGHANKTVDIVFNNTTAPTSGESYVLLIDDDGTFTNATAYELVSIGNDDYAAYGVTLSDGDYLSIGEAAYSVTTAIKTDGILQEVNGEISDDANTNYVITLYPHIQSNFKTNTTCANEVVSARLFLRYNVGETYNHGTNQFDTDIDVDIDGYDAFTAGTSLINLDDINLAISEDKPEVLYTLDISTDYASLKRLEIDPTTFTSTVGTTGMTIEPELMFKAWIEVTTKSKVIETVNPVVSINAPVATTSATGYKFSWNNSLCADDINYEFQLLRLYNNDAAKTTQTDIITTPDWSEALSILTPKKELILTLAEGTGYYAWRVRPIGTYYEGGIADSRNWGTWTASVSETADQNITAATPDYLVFYTQFDEAKNFIFSRAFAEGGRIKESISYANGLMFAQQSQYRYNPFTEEELGHELAETKEISRRGNGNFFAPFLHWNFPTKYSREFKVAFDAMKTDAGTLDFVMQYKDDEMEYTDDKDSAVTHTATFAAEDVWEHFELDVDDAVLANAKYIGFNFATDDNAGVISIRNLSVKEIIDPQPVVASQTIYDYSGRAALSTLAAPIANQTELGYKAQFLKSGTDVYTAAHFDADNNYLNASDAIKADGGVLFDYYSNKNDDLRIPDAQGYPFTRTIFENDGNNRPKETGLVSSTLTIGSGKNVRTDYGVATEDELLRMFGDEATGVETVFKTIVTDENNITSVQYTNKEGQTIATAIIDNDLTSSLTDLSSVATSSFNINEKIQDETIPDGLLSATNSKRLTFARQTDVTFDYQISPAVISSTCGTYCNTCAYKVIITVYPIGDMTNKKVYESPIAAGTFNTAGTCSVSTATLAFKDVSVDPAVNQAVPFTLQDLKGSYIISRTVVLDESARDQFIDSVTTNLKSDIDAIIDPIKERLDDVIAGTRTMDAIETYIDDTLISDAITATDWDVLIYDINETTGAEDLIFDSDVDPSFSGTLDGDMILHVKYGTCCEVEIPLQFKITSPCDQASNKHAEFGNLIATEIFGVANWDSAFGASGDYEFSTRPQWATADKTEAKFETIIQNMLAESAYNSDEYSCENLWECASSAAQTLKTLNDNPFTDGAGDPISLSQHVDNLVSDNAGQLPDWATSGNLHNQHSEFLEMFLQCAGYHYAGVTDNDAKLEQYPYKYVRFSKEWRNESHTEFETRHRYILDMFCNMTDNFDPDSWEACDADTWDIPDVTDADFIVSCDTPACDVKFNGPTDNIYTITIRDSDSAPWKYTFNEHHYAVFAQLLDNMLDHNAESVSESDLEDMADDAKGELEQLCKDACLNQYDYILSELVELYDPDANNIYINESGDTLAYEDICCTAESVVEDCQSQCTISQLKENCDGVGAEKIVAIGNQTEFEFFNAVINGRPKIALPETSTTTVYDPGTEALAMVDLLNELFVANSDLGVNNTAFDTKYTLDHYYAYNAHKSIFKAEDYKEIEILSSPLGKIRMHKTTGSNDFDFILDDDLVTTSDMDDIHSVSVAVAVNNTDLEGTVTYKDGTIGTTHNLGTTFTFEGAGGNVNLVVSEAVTADSCRSGYDRVVEPAGGVKVPPYCYQNGNGNQIDYFNFNVDWDKHYGGDGYETMVNTITKLNNDSGYVFCARSHSNAFAGYKAENRMGGTTMPDYWAVKIDLSGNIVWENTMGGSSDEYPREIQETKDGKFLIVGESKSNSSADKSENSIGFYDIWVVLLNSDGTISKENTIGGSLDDYGFSIVEAADSGFFIGGHSSSGVGTDKSYANNGTTDYWLIKLDKNLVIEWDTNYGGASGSVSNLHSIKQFPNGDLLLAGSSNGASGNDKSESSTGYDFWLIKLDKEGRIIWEKTYNHDGDEDLADVEITEDGGVVIVGSDDESGRSDDYRIMRINRFGDVLWDNLLTATTSEVDVASDVELTSDGGYIVIGTSWTDTGGFKTDGLEGGLQDDYWLVKFDANGDTTWNRSIGSSSTDAGASVIELQPGEYLLSGDANTIGSASGEKSSLGNGDHDVWILKYDVTAACSTQTVCVKWEGPISQATNEVVTIPNRSTTELEKAKFVKDAILGSMKECELNIEDDMREKYQDACRIVDDELEITYSEAIHHYTLFGHDRAGNLIYTIPPEGVDTQDPNDVRDRTTASDHPAHTHVTKYKYNSYSQLIEQETPDGGTSKFTYNPDGLIRFSENQKQRDAATKSISYTKYDALGRIIEVGEYDTTYSIVTGNLDLYLGLDATPTYPKYGSGCFPPISSSKVAERTITEYSVDNSVTYIPDTSGYAAPQTYIRNRISHSYTDDDGNLSTKFDQIHTYYSYDPHGNVKWLVQDIPGFGKSFMAYEYDLVSGNVLKVKYNEGLEDQLYHRYEYDADNRLTMVETSRDNVIWDVEAEYEFYTHGPASRVIIGEDRVQGMDYVFTIQGWLKSMNHVRLDRGLDPGSDGVGRGRYGFTGTDEYAQTLNYFDGDFRRWDDADGDGVEDAGEADSPFNTDFQTAGGLKSGHLTANSLDLYNGNISTWTNNAGVSNAGSPDYASTLGPNYRYTYDQLNRLIKADNLSYNTGTQAFTNDVDNRYDVDLTYDANGNIKTLKRRRGAGALMDDMSYIYKSGTNQLDTVKDASTDGAAKQYTNGDHIYTYDGIGNLLDEDAPATAEDLDYEWTVYGKVKKVTLNNGDKVEFVYDAAGNRSKKVFTDNGTGDSTVTYYVRDASGNPMAVYKSTEETNGHLTYILEDQPIYGADRLGSITPNTEVYKERSQADVSDVVIVEVVHDTRLISSTTSNTLTDNAFGTYVCVKNMSKKAISLDNYTMRKKPFGGSWVNNDLTGAPTIYPGQYLIIAAEEEGTEAPDCDVSSVEADFLEVNGLPQSILSDPKVKWHWMDINFRQNAEIIVLGQHDYNSGTPKSISSTRWDKDAPSSYETANNAYDNDCDAANHQALHRLNFMNGTTYDKTHWTTGDAQIYHDPVHGNIVSRYEFCDRTLGEKQYELKDHLGNVRVTVTDRKLVDYTYSHQTEDMTGVAGADGTYYRSSSVSCKLTNGVQTVTPTLSDATVSEGDLVTATVWVYRTTLSDLSVSTNKRDGYLAIKYRDGSNVKQYQVTKQIVVPRTGEWFKIQVQDVVPAGLSITKVEIVGSVDGNVASSTWYDDLTLEIADPDETKGFYADFKFSADYYPFGSLLRSANPSDYRFGFQGQEMDDEIREDNGNSLDFGARMYDSRLGRFIKTDVFEGMMPQTSPYVFALNNPICLIDKDGNLPSDYRERLKNLLIGKFAIWITSDPDTRNSQITFEEVKHIKIIEEIDGSGIAQSFKFEAVVQTTQINMSGDGKIEKIILSAEKVRGTFVSENLGEAEIKDKTSESLRQNSENKTELFTSTKSFTTFYGNLVGEQKDKNALNMSEEDLYLGLLDGKKEVVEYYLANGVSAINLKAIAEYSKLIKNVTNNSHQKRRFKGRLVKRFGRKYITKALLMFGLGKLTPYSKILKPFLTKKTFSLALVRDRKIGMGTVEHFINYVKELNEFMKDEKSKKWNSNPFSENND